MGDASKRYVLLSMSVSDYDRFVDELIPSGNVDATFFNRSTEMEIDVVCEVEQASTDLHTLTVIIRRWLRSH